MTKSTSNLLMFGARQVSGVNEKILHEMEKILQRELTPEEVRLILLAETVRRDVDSDKAA